MEQKTQPLAVVFGGINGAGKSTAAQLILAERYPNVPFVNADSIARGINSKEPEAVAAEAGVMTLKMLNEMVENLADFSFESTLAGRGYIRFLRKLRESGYRVICYYYWLSSPNLAVDRVGFRVKTGGHAIPLETIHRRYFRSIQNFWNEYRLLADYWALYNNTNSYLLTAEGCGEQSITVFSPADFQTWLELKSHVS